MLELVTTEGAELVDADTCTISHSGALHLYRDAQQIGVIAPGHWEQVHTVTDEEADSIQATEINISFTAGMGPDEIDGIMRRLKNILDE